MRKIALAFVFVLAVSFPLFAGDFIGMDLSVGVGANKDFMDAGITAADLSVSAGLSLFPIRFEDFAAGITIRATIGSSIVDDSTFFGWYALTPLLTLVFLDEAPMSISGGYGPYAYEDAPEVYLYGPAVLLGFGMGSSVMQIGMIGPSVFIGFGFAF